MSVEAERQTWGLDDPVLVRFGGVAVTRTVYKTLHHFCCSHTLLLRVFGLTEREVYFICYNLYLKPLPTSNTP